VNGLVVVKLGGGLARVAGGLDAAGRAVGRAARHRPLLVVPGGGALADAVRAAERELTISQEAAHWMAILAMDQYAYAITCALPQGAVVHDLAEIGQALAAGQVPVLAPYRWMLAADVLPHRWEITSDSIAAFIAGALDADLLVLLKPVSGPVEALVDPCFQEVAPRGLKVVVLGSTELGRLEEVVAEPGMPPAV
jgi:aspartokinase-like uncharacterized kinase